MTIFAFLALKKIVVHGVFFTLPLYLNSKKCHAIYSFSDINMFLFVETSNDMKIYSTTEIHTTPTSYSGENVTKGNIFIQINVRDNMYLTILK